MSLIRLIEETMEREEFMVTTKRKILFFSLLISIISSIVTFGILYLFNGADSWKNSLIASSILFVLSYITSYRYLIRAFNYDVR